jgi:uncharacterized protein YndB with AHSA1/START domain
MTHEIAISRIFTAPRELVFQAFVDPDQLAQWFGPVGASLPRDTIEVDARVGGHLRFVMTTDDMTIRNPVEATFTEVIDNELIVADMRAEGVPGVEGILAANLRLEFHDEGDGKTRLELRQGPFDQEIGDQTEDGWESSFTKLDTLLAGRGRR